MTADRSGATAGALSSRRRLLSLLGAVACSLSSSPGWGIASGGTCADLRGARIFWLVGWSPGGGYDLYSRLLAPFLGEALGAEVVVENVPGASGLVAARRISTSTPDGRTLGVLYGAGMLLAPYTNPAFAPDLESDFTLLGRIADQEQVLVCGPKLGVDSLQAFAAIGQQRTLVLGSTGPATMSVLLQLALARMLGLEVELVLGFPGSAELLAALLRGDVDATITSEDTARSQPALRPLLLLAPEPDTAATPPMHLPILHGPRGVISLHPELFPSPAQARADVAALSDLLQVGRLIGAPPTLAAETLACLESAVASVLTDPRLRDTASRAGRLLNPATGKQVYEYVRKARLALPRFVHLLERAVPR